jgi:hypothetical protein
MIPNPLAVWKRDHGVEGEDTKAEWALLGELTRLRQALEELRQAEEAAQRQDSIGNEGDADAIRRFAIRAALRSDQGEA